MEDTSVSSDPSQQLNSLLGGSSGQPIIPESMTVFLVVCFVILNVLSIVFMIFWIMGMMRRWKVQTAILRMQKDIVEIKESLAKPAEPVPVAEPTFTEPAKLKSDIIASSDEPTAQNS